MDNFKLARALRAVLKDKLSYNRNPAEVASWWGLRIMRNTLDFILSSLGAAFLGNGFSNVSFALLLHGNENIPK